MIRLFRDYYDKHGVRYKVLSFDGSRYACQSYHDNKCVFLLPNELFINPPVKSERVKFTDIIKKEEVTFTPKVEVKTPESSFDVISEPVYEMPDEFQVEPEVQKDIPLKDNIEETAEDDFYADF